MQLILGIFWFATRCAATVLTAPVELVISLLSLLLW
jgi:hypothetical protein